MKFDWREAITPDWKGIARRNAIKRTFNLLRCLGVISNEETDNAIMELYQMWFAE